MEVPAPDGEHTGLTAKSSIPTKTMFATCDGESVAADTAEDQAKLASARAFIMAEGRCIVKISCSFQRCVV